MAKIYVLCEILLFPTMLSGVVGSPGLICQRREETKHNYAEYSAEAIYTVHCSN